MSIRAKSMDKIKSRECQLFPILKRGLCSRAEKYQEKFLNEAYNLVELYNFLKEGIFIFIYFSSIYGPLNTIP